MAVVSAAPSAEIGCCHRCALRLSGCRDYERYFEKELAADQGPEDVCGLCLGLLERAADLRSDLSQKLKAGSFEASSFVLSFTMPVICVFRHYVLLCYLRECDSAVQAAHDNVVELKDVLRWFLAQELMELGHMAGTDPEKPALTVHLNCTYAGAALSELSCLEGLGGGRRKANPGARKAKRRRIAEGKGGKGDAPDNVDTTPTTISTAAVVEALGNITPEHCRDLVECDSLVQRLQRVSGAPAAVAASVGRESFYFRGRYVKLSRNMPQSPWILDGERKGEGSVEESICGPAAEAFGASECKFHAEGREDIDVRMLGAGRTFVIEVKNAQRTAADLAGLAQAITASGSGHVRVSGLAPCHASVMANLQKDAENHRKTYVCVCWSQKPLCEEDLRVVNAHKDLEVQQKTPVRVLHRRAPAVRPRTLHWIEAGLINPHYLSIRLSTQAGMYIKEWVHGDFGRTRPSLRDLLGGARVEILQLDVEGLEDTPAEAPGSCAVTSTNSVGNQGLY